MSRTGSLSLSIRETLRLLLCLLCAVHCMSEVSKETTIRSPNHLVSERRFYIYESDEWNAVSSAALFPRDRNERLENQLYNGAGPVINASRGEYHTDQYQLFSMLFYRALKDPRRTLNPEEATSFLIPYDFSLDAAYYKNCARSQGVCYDFRKCPLAPQVESLLKASPYFTRNHGKDHILIVGMNYAMDHYILKPKCKALLSGTCANCTKFAIDDYSYMYADDTGILARGDRWHAIPFPADFHWSRTYRESGFPWENTHRPLVASYIGSDKSFYPPSRRLRGSIVHYCSLHPDHCAQQSYGLNGTRFSFKVDQHTPLVLARHSVFCFQPTGDLMTRKGLFDSILQGCIPVVFDPLTASVMYTWHWEEAFWREISVDLAFHPTAFRYFDPVEHLVRLTRENATWIAETQRKIRERVFALQYGLDGLVDRYQYASSIPYLTMRKRNDPLSVSLSLSENESETHASIFEKGVTEDGEMVYFVRNNTNSSNNKEEIISSLDRWPKDKDGRYLRDAYDITMDYALAWHSGLWEDVRHATVPECWNGWLDKEQNRCRPESEKPKPTR